MIVSSFGSLQAMSDPNRPLWNTTNNGVTLYDHREAYAQIYATQPNVRICVDFLSRNIAQLGLPVFRRVSDTDRVRLTDHDLARWLAKPNPATRQYRLIESLVADLGIYFDAYWMKVRYQDAGRDAIGLVRLPPDQMDVIGGLLPEFFRWTVNGKIREFELTEVVHFDGYNPSNPLKGLSPLETLRRILAEESAAGANREAYWRNAGRMEGIIEQTDKAPKWTEPQQKQFREQWQEFSAGGAKAGMTAILPQGMSIKPWSFSSKDSEYIQGGKLRREICAAEYHIPLPLVGILEHATFSNIKEQHKHLYQDCLGPWLEMIEQEIEGQLLTECDDQRDVYIEFNIAAKLAGSFEEQSTSLRTLVGRPIMTVNEGRARLNLPAHDDPSADEIAAQQGGPASGSNDPMDTAPPPAPADDSADAAAIQPVIESTRTRQAARLAKLPADERAAAFFMDIERWDRELARDLSAVTGADSTALATATNRETLARLEAAS